jgi:hypothetical protein
MWQMIKNIVVWLIRQLLQSESTPKSQPVSAPNLAQPQSNTSPSFERQTLVKALDKDFGFHLIESDPKGNARPLNQAELTTLHQTVTLMGPVWSTPFQQKPIQFWLDRNPGGGHYGDGWLRIGDPLGDPSVLYRILIHEGTHASNEYRGWLYEREYCTRPGLDWRSLGNDRFSHPRQQGASMEPGDWETLPVDSRDVSVAPGEDLAEMVRYYVHSVRKERQFLWPLDQSKPGVMLWHTSPTRHVFVRDVFLKLPKGHTLYEALAPDLESKAKANLGLA